MEFKIGDIIVIKHQSSHFYAGQRGRITHVGTPGGARLEVKMRDNNTTYVPDADAIIQPTPKVGDLVRVLAGGRWQAQEGNITEIDNHGNIYIDELDHGWERPRFAPFDIEIIEKLPPLKKNSPGRVEGAEIDPEKIQRGDKIAVVTKNTHGDLETTHIVEGIVAKIEQQSFTSYLVFYTRGGKIIFINDKHERKVSLVKSIDTDAEFEALSEFKLGDIIGFPDKEGGVETNIAVKQDYGYWSLVMGTKKAKVTDTVGIVNLLNQKGVTFSVVRKAPEPFEFPKGTFVKVSRGFSDSLASGDWKVITEGQESSVIKSRGISASTYTVPNKYLSKA